MANPDIQVTVKSSYIAKESMPEKKRYVFSYTVTIRNTGDRTAQLISRHWIITNGETLKSQEVRGDGVIGKQPHIKPGESYTYTSGTVMEAPVGTMQGSYRMIDDEGEYFDASIPVFTLAATHSVH
jgi:ApaG protein